MTIDIDGTLEQVISLKRQIKSLEGMLDTALDALRQAVDDGELDPTFKHDDVAFDLRPGRASYSYPPAVIELSLKLKDLQSAAVADGTATIKRGEPYWTIKLPKA
jgi:hypothetical protein